MSYNLLRQTSEVKSEVSLTLRTEIPSEKTAIPLIERLAG